MAARASSSSGSSRRCCCDYFSFDEVRPTGDWSVGGDDGCHFLAVLSAIDGGDATQAKDALRVLARTADKAAASRKIHRNKAARITSRPQQ
ncbi:MAG: 30S ribosomal protein S20, partial [Planctomycetia bacterium]